MTTKTKIGPKRAALLRLRLDEIEKLDAALAILVPVDILAEAYNGDSLGVCLACDHIQGMCEPDARMRTCEACGTAAVYGGQELMVMRGGE